MKLFIQVITFMVAGGVMGSADVSIDKWQYWVVILCLMTVQISPILDRD